MFASRDGVAVAPPVQHNRHMQLLQSMKTLWDCTTFKSSIHTDYYSIPVEVQRNGKKNPCLNGKL